MFSMRLILIVAAVDVAAGYCIGGASLGSQLAVGGSRFGGLGNVGTRIALRRPREYTLRSESKLPDSARRIRAGTVDAIRMDVNADLRKAAEFGFASQVEDYAKAGGDVNSVDPEQSGKAAIHLAAFQGHVEAVVKLLELGADINMGTDSGATALHFAGAYGHLALVQCLLDKGADPTIVNEFGEDAHHMANMKTLVHDVGAFDPTAETSGGLQGRFSDRVDFVTIVKIIKEARDNWKSVKK